MKPALLPTALALTVWLALAGCGNTTISVLDGDDDIDVEEGPEGDSLSDRETGPDGDPGDGDDADPDADPDPDPDLPADGDLADPDPDPETGDQPDGEREVTDIPDSCGAACDLFDGCGLLVPGGPYGDDRVGCHSGCLENPAPAEVFDCLLEAACSQVEECLALIRSLRVTGFDPAHGTAGVPLQTTLSVTFNKPLRADLERRFLFIIPEPAARGEESLADGGRKLRLPVTLAADTHYALVVPDVTGNDGSQLDRIYQSSFTTAGRMASAVVTGTITLDPDLPFVEDLEDTLVLATPELPDGEGKDDGEGGLPPLVSLGYADPVSGTYRLELIPSGAYYILAAKNFDLPTALFGWYDLKADLRPTPEDLLALTDGQTADRIDIVLYHNPEQPQPTAWIEGGIVFLGGPPIPADLDNIHLVAFDHIPFEGDPAGPRFASRADPNGNFRLGVTAGTWFVLGIYRPDTPDEQMGFHDANQDFLLDPNDGLPIGDGQTLSGIDVTFFLQ